MQNNRVLRLALALLLGYCGAAGAVTPMVSMGDTHGLALRADGTVLAWGSDTYGQLGVGRPLISTVPVKVPGLSSVISIAGGNGHTLAVRQDGTVWAWGQNDFGQLGDGTTVDRSSPVQVPGITNALMACAGGVHSAVLRQDQTVWTWGNNWYGQLGNGTTGTSSAPGPVTGLTGVTSIACYFNQTIALLQDGTVRAWGGNANGELGDGTTTDRWLPVPVSGLSNVMAINGTAALKHDGTVWEWGYTTWSARGPILIPVQSPGISGAFALSKSYGGDYGGRLEAISSDRVTWWEWTPGTTPSAQAPVGSLTSAASAPYHTLLLKTDGTVVASGLNNHGELGIGATPTGGWDWYSSFQPVVGLANVTAVAAGDSHSLALDANGYVWAWGDDAHGQLGRGAALSNTVPTLVPGLSNIVQVSASGPGASLAVDQSGNVWAWGLNYHGQLGDGTFANRSSPVRLTAIQDVQAVADGAVTTMALKRDGTVWAWGNNFVGQLGNGSGYSGNTSTIPVPVPGLSNVISIAANWQMLAVRQDGTVWAWGGNDSGELGLGTTTSSLVPVPIPGLSGVKSVAASYGHSFAVKLDGTAMAWGSGALGDGPWRTGQLTPIPVPGLNNVAEISASTYHTLARRTDGSVWGWGTTWGQGSELGSSPRGWTPVPIANLGPMQGIATGQGNSAMLGSDGLLYTAGANAAGQLGDGTFALHPDFVLAVNPGANGYLNLLTGTTTNVAAALRVPFFVASTGGISANSAVVKTTTKFNAADVGKSGAIFVTAMVPVGTVGTIRSMPRMNQAAPAEKAGVSSYVLIQLTSTGWQQVVNGQLIPYASGVLGDQLAAQTILNGTDTTNLQGAQFCLGYGTSAADMTAAGNMRAVATIPTDPNAASTATVSCIVQGASAALNVSNSGSGAGVVSSSPSGINCGSTCSASFGSSSSVTLTATPASGSTFAGWSGDCTGTGACTVTMNSARNVTAAFNAAGSGYMLNVSNAGSGTGRITSSPAGVDCGAICGRSFAVGTSVTLTATPDAGSAFSGWSGACNGTGTCTVTLGAITNVAAFFSPIGSAAPFLLTAANSGSGSGRVTSSPTGIDCGTTCGALITSGTNVTLTAIPASGSTFAGWTGACTGTGSCTVTMSAAKNVTAVFTPSSPAGATPFPGGVLTSFGTRGTVTPATPMYGSFALANASVIYIAVLGPTLGNLGYTNSPLDLPNVRVYDAAGKDVLSNTSGGVTVSGCPGSATVANYYASVRGSALNANDTCVSAILAAGVYTFTINPNTASSSGELLFEVTVNPLSSTAPGGVMTVFGTRGTVASTTPMYGSFALANPSVMYIAVLGSTLGILGYTNNPLNLPNVRVYDASGKDVLSSASGGVTVSGCPSSATVSNYYASVRGSALNVNDTCVSANLAAGVYTFTINPNTTSSSGEMLFEVTVNP
jgi:alpha-tubulin suppressor-like RCC1 family protein